MKTLPKQTSQSGTAKSMFSQEDSPANLSPLLAEERERTITATSGHRCFERYGRYTPLGSLVKTLMESRRWWSPAKSLRWDAQTIFSKRITYTERKADSPSTKSVQTSKPKDIPSNRLLFQLAVSERPTEGIEYGLLQEEYQQLLLTPTAVMITEDPKKFKERAKKNGYRNGTTYGSLASQVMFSDILPTPNAMDIAHKDMEINERGRRNPKKDKTDHSLGLEDMAVAQLLPTPTALDKGGGRINKSLSPNAAERPTLALAARKGLLPTPCSIEATKFTKTINPNSQMGQGLTALAVNGLLPTPTAMEVKHSNRVKGLKEQGVKGMYSRKNGALRPNGLTDFLDFNGMMPTPSARDWKGCTNPGVKKVNGNVYGETLPDTVKKVTGSTSQLNPLFVEEMMGFPLMWTALPFLSPSGDKNP
nr:MAG TPA: hypothetical protein [Bacteriophage sp.]